MDCLMCQGVIPRFLVNNVDMALPIFYLIAKCTHIVNNVNIGGNATLRSCFKRTFYLRIMVPLTLLFLMTNSRIDKI